MPQRWLRLSDHPLPAFQDIRHEGDGRYPEPAGNERLLLQATLAASDVVIASPLYWYSVSASTKLYLDYWSGWLRVPGVDFKAEMRGKTLWAITSYSRSEPALAEPLAGTLRLTAKFLNMRWGGLLLSSSNRPGDVLANTEALAQAKRFFAPAAAPGPAAPAPAEGVSP